MLSDSQCALIEKGLTEDVEPRKLAAYLCLHMGLSTAEASAVKVSDIDFSTVTLTISRVLTRKPNNTPENNANKPRYAEKNFFTTISAGTFGRTIPLPSHVYKLLYDNMGLYPCEDCYLISGETEMPKSHYLQNVLAAVNAKYDISGMISPMMLRNVFIRRCLENGVDLCTLGTVLGIQHLDEITKKFGEYITPKPKEINVLEKYSVGYAGKKKPECREMNLLILGAGSHGHTIKETAEAIGIFNKIAFLDDNLKNKEAIDVIERCENYIDDYPLAFVAIGNSTVRKVLTEKIEKAGFVVPFLYDPSANISPSAKLMPGVYVGARAIVGAQTILHKGVIIASGAILSNNVVSNEYSHIDSGAMIKKNCVISAMIKIESGCVVDAK